MAKLQKSLLILFLFLLVNCLVLEIDGKRSFSVRIRSKNSGRSGGRRKTAETGYIPQQPSGAVHNPGPAKPVPAPKQAETVKTQPKPSAPDGGAPGPDGAAGNSRPLGPPPAYPGMGNNPVPAHGAPPAYSSGGGGAGVGGLGNPPSYAASQNLYRNQRESYPSSSYGNGGANYPYNSYGSNIQSIPPRGSGVGGTGLTGDSTSFQGLGSGHNAYGGPSSMGGGGGLYNQHGMGTMGNYGGGYGHGGGGSGLSFGNILAGVALWNVARGFNSYPRQQHVHIHHNHNQTESNVENINNQNQQPLSVSTATTGIDTNAPLQIDLLKSTPTETITPPPSHHHQQPTTTTTKVPKS